MMARTSATGLQLLKKKYKARNLANHVVVAGTKPVILIFFLEFEEDILKKIEKETKGSVEKVLIATFSGKKDPTKEINPKNAQRDAEVCHKIAFWKG